jgi:hypothetical protein
MIGGCRVAVVLRVVKGSAGLEENREGVLFGDENKIVAY